MGLMVSVPSKKIVTQKAIYAVPSRLIVLQEGSNGGIDQVTLKFTCPTFFKIKSVFQQYDRNVNYADLQFRKGTLVYNRFLASGTEFYERIYKDLLMEPQDAIYLHYNSNDVAGNFNISIWGYLVYGFSPSSREFFEFLNAL